MPRIPSTALISKAAPLAMSRAAAPELGGPVPAHDSPQRDAAASTARKPDLNWRATPFAAATTVLCCCTRPWNPCDQGFESVPLSWGGAMGISDSRPLACHTAAPHPPASIAAGHRLRTSASVPRNPGRLLYFRAVRIGQHSTTAEMHSDRSRRKSQHTGHLPLVDLAAMPGVQNQHDELASSVVKAPGSLRP